MLVIRDTETQMEYRIQKENLQFFAKKYGDGTRISFPMLLSDVVVDDGNGVVIKNRNG